MLTAFDQHQAQVTVTEKDLAQLFSVYLTAALDPAELTEVNRLNATEQYAGDFVCASHEFCDLNKCMIAALDDLGLESSDPRELVDAAWWRAKAAGFDPEKIILK